MPRPCSLIVGLFLEHVQTAAIKQNKTFMLLQHLFYFIAHETTDLRGSNHRHTERVFFLAGLENS